VIGERLRKKLVVAVTFLAMVSLVAVVAACGEEETSTTAAPTSAPSTTSNTAAPSTETTAPESTTSSSVQPTYGGVLKYIHVNTPQVLGYWPEQGPDDEWAVQPAIERIMKFTAGGILVPHLAESVVEDPDRLTITVKLRQGIKFHDGSELTAEVAKWNYDLGIPSGKLQFADALKEFEIVDKYTYVLHLNYWHNRLLESFGWMPMFSKEAFEKNGGADWARTHVVGTGPFILQEYNRDQSVKWVKNPDYWQQGLPYLDGIELMCLPDRNTAALTMMAGDADFWQSPTPQYLAQFKEKGVNVNIRIAKVGLGTGLIFNLADPNSPVADQRVREAMEYAVDKAAINEATGYGFTQVMDAVTPDPEWGADSIPVKREYNPEKAKQLLAEAGYANGCPITILALVEEGGRNTGAEAMKGYLDAAGFQTTLDIADPGRFFGSAFGTGWKDCIAMFWGVDENFLFSLAAWFGPSPKTKLAGWAPPEEYYALYEPAMQARTLEEQKEKTKAIVAYMNEHCLVIPGSFVPLTPVYQPWVHANYPDDGISTFYWDQAWMEKH